LRGIHFYWDKILVFTTRLKRIFLGTRKFWGHKNWGALPPTAPLGYGPAYKTKFSHLDENIAALCFWLNSSKSDDLRTNAFSTSTKCKSHEKIYFGFVDHHCRALQEVRINVYFVFDSLCFEL